MQIIKLAILSIWALHTSVIALDSTTFNHALLQNIATSKEWLNLLHYRNNASLISQKSGFFLAPNGATNALAELEATLGLLDSTNASELFCRYPARALYLSTFFSDISHKVAQYNCEGYNEFREIVPSDSIAIIFAAESDIYPGSAMGHIYLALQGVAKKRLYKDFGDNMVLDIKQGEKLGYSISFFANVELGVNPLNYIRAISGSIGGIYALAPLENASFEYITNQKRSLYEIDLRLDNKQKDMLLAHLWELKDVPISYAFISHNCNDALKMVLRVANSDFDTPQTKPYQTPIEYIKALKRANLIIHTTFKFPQTKQDFINTYGKNDIFNTRDSAKLSLSFSNVDSQNLLHLYVAPIYADIKNVNNAYTELVESRLLSMQLSANLSKNKAFISSIEALHLFSLLDFPSTKSLSTYINLSFSNHFLEQDKTRLKPNLSFGAGIGAYMGDFAFLALPLVGYDYVRAHNGFIDMRFLAIARFSRARIIGSYDYFIDIDNQRGYTQSLSAFVGINLYKQCDAYIELKWLDYNAKYASLALIKGGISFNF